MNDNELRARLVSTFVELADQAITRRNYDAASAFQFAAELALGQSAELATPTKTTSFVERVVNRNPADRAMRAKSLQLKAELDLAAIAIRAKSS